MKFLWPEALPLLLLVPLLVVAYVVALRRRRKSALRYPLISVIKGAIGPGQRLRRHIPPVLFLLSVAAAIVAVARPAAVVVLPSQQRTVILAIDVSLSMGATDVDPNRITAAQAAAKTFVEERPPNVRIGLVAFGGSATLVQPPTDDRDELLSAIDRFQLQRATATGSALYVAVAALLPKANIDVESLVLPGATPHDTGRRAAPLQETPKKAIKAVVPGSYSSGVIILMSDGRRTTGPDPMDAAKLAADYGVRVFTVGFGTSEGSQIGVEGWSVFVRLDEETLKSIADVTRGEYFHAVSATELKSVYQRLNARLVLERKDTELTFLFAALAAVLMLASLVCSLLWFHR
jgi:Ca-activated chloride channel family protein